MVTTTSREKIYQVIFGTDTVAGQRFDILLIYMILLSVAAVILDSVGSLPSAEDDLRLAKARHKKMRARRSELDRKLAWVQGCAFELAFWRSGGTSVFRGSSSSSVLPP